MRKLIIIYIFFSLSGFSQILQSSGHLLKTEGGNAVRQTRYIAPIADTNLQEVKDYYYRVMNDGGQITDLQSVIAKMYELKADTLYDDLSFYVNAKWGVKIRHERDTNFVEKLYDLSTNDYDFYQVDKSKQPILIDGAIYFTSGRGLLQDSVTFANTDTTQTYISEIRLHDVAGTGTLNFYYDNATTSDRINWYFTNANTRKIQSNHKFGTNPSTGNITADWDTSMNDNEYTEITVKANFRTSRAYCYYGGFLNRSTIPYAFADDYVSISSALYPLTKRKHGINAYGTSYSGTFSMKRFGIFNKGLTDIQIADDSNLGSDTNVVFNTPLFVFRTDDGLSGNYDKAYTILNPMGFKATFYVYASAIGSTSSYDTWEEVAIEHAAGFEIGDHFYTHTNMNNLTPEQLHAGFISTDSAFTAHSIPIPVSFSSPLTPVDQREIDTIAHHRQTNQNYDYEYVFSKREPIYAINAINITDVELGNATYNKALYYIDFCIRYKLGMVFLNHSVSTTGVPAVQSLMNYLHERGYHTITTKTLYDNYLKK